MCVMGTLRGRLIKSTHLSMKESQAHHQPDCVVEFSHPHPIHSLEGMRAGTRVVRDKASVLINACGISASA